MTDAEIVRTLATKCMGWKEVPWVWGPSLSEHPTEAFFRMNGAGNVRVTVGDNTFWFDPLSSITDAFMVVEKMRERELYLTLHDCRDHFLASFNAIHYSRVGPFSQDSNPARAIAIAAIAALEGK